MLKTLQSWLNGNRNYTVGVEIFAVLSSDKSLIKTFRSGQTLNNNWRLQEEMKALFYQIKKKQAVEKVTVIAADTIVTSFAARNPNNYNTDIYDACKLEADNMYKESMNKRAVLFSLLPADIYQDPNRPDLILQRSKLSVEVVELYNKASALYDKANYVLKNGRLPGTDKEEEQETDYSDLPDFKVKPALDNLRKNINKIKSRPQTPERISLLIKHEANLKILEEKWHLLKQ
jgi:hypothetical protein